jgi:hypothetical protein
MALFDLAGAAETGVTEPSVASRIAVPAAINEFLRERCSGERTGVSPEVERAPTHAA